MDTKKIAKEYFKSVNRSPTDAEINMLIVYLEEYNREKMNSVAKQLNILANSYDDIKDKMLILEIIEKCFS